MTQGAATQDEADADARFMSAAIALARRGLGVCAPNPAVGALIVRDGVILARGWTQPGGRPHAETEALARLSEADRADEARGATLYVTLEPCSHHGRTPPCAQAVIEAGVSRVVAALRDPDPRVGGRGFAMLRAAGVETRESVCETQALRANLGHVLRVTRNRPMVTLKLAMTADGFAAAREERRLMITGDEANRATHMMRALHDAILIGAGTARADDPLLTVRLPGLEGRRPLRVVLDPRLTLSPASRLAQDARAAPVLVIAGEDASHESAARLEALGVEVACAPADGEGRVDPRDALALLAARGVTRLFCEGGPALAESLLAADVVDELVLLKSPRRLDAPGLLALRPERLAALDAGAVCEKTDAARVGDDQLIRYSRIL